MRFDDLAVKAGAEARDAANRVERPEIGAIRSARRRRGGVAALLAAFVGTIAAVGAVAWWPSAEPSEPAAPQGTTTSTTATDAATGTPQGQPSIQVVVSDLPIDEAIPLRIVAFRPNSTSIAVLDFEAATLSVYPPGSHAVTHGFDGAVMDGQRRLFVWSGREVQMFTGRLDRADLALTPAPATTLRSTAPPVRVVPVPGGDLAWLVQPGVVYGDVNEQPVVELIELPGGRRRGLFELEGNTFPVGATDEGLVLNSELLIDTGDGWITQPGSERVIFIAEDGTETDLGSGRAIAAGPDAVVRVVCESNRPECNPRNSELVISRPDGSEQVVVTKPQDGNWVTVGEPYIPNEAMPLQTVSPDASTLLVGFSQELDVNGVSTSLLAVDLMAGTVGGQLSAGLPLATWSHDGRWIALIEGDNVRLIDVADPESSIELLDIIPPDHFALAAG
ncbi:MAG TPA: hypothetical protein VGC11_10355 [Acidimicrobiia bacterium]|jgi:hypothetical protein